MHVTIPFDDLMNFRATLKQHSQIDSFRNDGEIPVIRRLLSKLAFHSTRPVDIPSSNDLEQVIHANDNQSTIEQTKSSVGIISLYAAQSYSISRAIQNPEIPISTVDAFQGSENDLIILTTVRTKSIGFSADPKRLNVAISRAKGQLIIIGNRDLLEENVLWREILNYIQKNGCIMDGLS